MCQPHWDGLRAAIDERGLGHLVARSGDAAVAGLISELETGTRLENFDPLMGAHNAIVNRCLETLGYEVLMNDGCPICFAKEHHRETIADCPGPPQCPASDEWFEGWIPGVADHMLEVYEELKA